MPNVVSKTPAPYSPLPTEILLIIFAIVCELDPDTIDEYHVPTQLLALTHTCRLFREACIGTPALWTCVPYGWSSALLALWMDRMPTILPLDLMACRLDQPSVDFRTMTAPDQYPRLLATAHRWRSVHLIRCDYASLKRFMTWTDSLLAATHLEELNIRVAPVEVDEPGAFPFSMHHRSFRTQLTSEIGQRRSLFDLEIPLPTTSLFPHLSRLTLYCPPFEFSAASMLSTVVELCIHIPFISEWEVWQSVLLQGISLEYLRITAQCEVDSRITAPVKLPCLRVLDLGIDTHKSFLSSWFRHVTAPELRKLSLTSSRERLWDTDGELISELFEFFIPVTPLLEDVFLHGNFPFIQSFLTTLSLQTENFEDLGDYPMPELHTLSLAMNLSPGRPDDLPLPLAFLQDIINLRQDAAINNVLQRVQPLRSLILSHCSIEEYEWFSGHVNHVVVQPDLGMSVVNSLLMFDRLKVDYTEGAEYWDLSD